VTIHKIVNRPSGVNWANPITSGLQLLVTGETRGYNLVTQALPVARTATFGTSLGGSALKFTGGVESLRFAHSSRFNAASGWTIFALVRSTSASGAQYVLNRNFDGSRVPASLCIGGNTTTNGAAHFNGTVWQKSGVVTDIRGDGILHTVIGTFNRANGGALDYYIDGVLNSNNGAYSLQTGSGDLYVGQYASDSASFIGNILICGYATRAWDYQDIAEFERDPYSVIAHRRIYVPTSVAAGGAPTLSAATYVPGSLTSTGFRPRVTATY
jgi:hypothetical protein